MATYVEINMNHTTGSDVCFFNTPAQAVEAAGLEDGDDCSVYLFIHGSPGKGNRKRRWGVRPGHDGWGMHTTAGCAKEAEYWFEDAWCYTDDEALAERLGD